MTRDEASEVLAQWGGRDAGEILAYPEVAWAALAKARRTPGLADGVYEQLAEAWRAFVSEACRADGRHVDEQGHCPRCGLSSRAPVE